MGVRGRRGRGGKGTNEESNRREYICEVMRGGKGEGGVRRGEGEGGKVILLEFFFSILAFHFSDLLALTPAPGFAIEIAD